CRRPRTRWPSSCTSRPVDLQPALKKAPALRRRRKRRLRRRKKTSSTPSSRNIKLGPVTHSPKAFLLAMLVAGGCRTQPPDAASGATMSNSQLTSGIYTLSGKVEEDDCFPPRHVASGEAAISVTDGSMNLPIPSGPGSFTRIDFTSDRATYEASICDGLRE